MIEDVTINGSALRAIMQSENAQNMVTTVAQNICRSANASNPGCNFVVHSRVLKVSAHAWVDPADYHTRCEEAYHGILEQAFYSSGA